jgi:hypothetical protein
METADGVRDFFPGWIARYSAMRSWDDHFSAQILSCVPDVAIELLSGEFLGDVPKSKQILGRLKISSNDAHLLDVMLANADLAVFIPDVFENCFDTFPVTELKKCIQSSAIDQSRLLSTLSKTSNPLHREVHVALIQRICNSVLSLDQVRNISEMLKEHTRHDVVLILSEVTCEDRDKWMWIIREIERARGERLISEVGEFLELVST